MKVERRNLQKPELRVEGDTTPVIKGYAAVFNAESHDLGFFYEKIRAGAFKKTITDGADVRALFNHDPAYVVGRISNKTLSLREDAHGLYVEAIPPDTTWARDLVSSIKRGDIDQMSIGFRSIKDEWSRDGEKRLRELLEVQLLEVSAVAFAAYPQTRVSARAYKGLDMAFLLDALGRWENGERRAEDCETMVKSIEILKRALSETEPGNHSGQNNDGAQVRNIGNLRRRLMIAEKELI